MENPATWKPIHHAIQAVITANQEPATLSYELLEALKKQKFLSAKCDDEALISAIDEAIWAHEDEQKRGAFGWSLTFKLGKVLS